jgi:hypothetical protein
MIDVGKGGTGGGMQRQRNDGAPSSWLPYVEVDDVKATVAKAAKAGATVMLPYQEIGQGMGAVGIFNDPTGATIGVWQKGDASPSSGSKKPAKAKGKAKKPAKVAAKTMKAAAKMVKDAAKKLAKKAKKAAGRSKK